MNRSYGAAPGGGKSTLIIQDVMQHEPLEDRNLLVIDPKGSFARELGKRLLCCGIPFVYDRVRDESKVLGYKLIEKRQSRVAQDVVEKALVEFFMAERGYSMKSGEHPLLRQGIWAAIKLVMHQRKPVPFWKIQNALRLFHPDHEKLLAGCTDRELIWVFGEYKRLTKFEQEKQLLPAQRVFDSVFGNPVLKDRCDGTFEPRGIVIVEGGGVALDSFRMLGMLLMMNCYERPGVIVVDEVQDGFITPWVVRQMETKREQGTFLWSAWQSPDFVDLTDRYFQACQWQSWGRCSSPEVARFGAEALAAVRDTHRVHHTEERKRQVHMGYSMERLKSFGTNGTTTDREQPIALYGTESDTISHYMSHTEQSKELQSQLVSLKVGERFLGTWDGVIKEYVPMQKPPYPRILRKSVERRFEEHLAKMKEELRWYRTPKYEEVQVVGAATRLNGRRKS